MAFTPALVEMQVLQEGGEAFTPVSQWNDAILSSSSAASYNLTAARTAMGVKAGQPLFVIFSADGPFWANFHAAAVIPAGNTTDGTASEFSPNQRYLASDITAISFISAASQKISMQFYRP